MLIGCITGPNFETAQRQVELAKQLCDGVEVRKDLLPCDFPLPNGFVIETNHRQSILSTGETISNYHNFEETPQDLDAILAKMAPANFYKICTMANSTTDALRMLIFTKDKPNVIGMCMGKLGHITRILGPVVSNPFTFAALGNEAVPDQMQAQELVETYYFHHLSFKTKIYALIGNPITQSISHLTHNAYFHKQKIDAVYIRMHLEKEELPQFFSLAKQLGISGVSVTIPFKEMVVPYIDRLEGDAKEMGVVNTITFADQIYGLNTDGKGALDAIEEHIFVRGKQCVILGAGGSAKAIAFEAKKRGAKVVCLSRRFNNIDSIPPYDILINTTPVMCPISLTKLLPQKVVMDINVGHHRISPFMKHAQSLGCILIYGQEMFEKQALGQFQRWSCITPNPITTSI